MKKLLVTAIGAAVAFGAFADSMRFESAEDGVKTISTLPGGDSYWSELAGSTNTYTVGAAGTIAPAPLPIASEGSQPNKALEIKTTFGKPLSLNAVSGGTATNINNGLYFDSLVKFTVCEDTPDQEYSGAKIIMWLQEQYDGDNVTGTNLMVRAGYLSMANNVVSATPTNYACALPSTFNPDGWNRVTIKAIADITGGRQVPGFAIYFNQNGSVAMSDVNSGAAKWDATFPEAELTEAAYLLNKGDALFPSLDQTTSDKDSLKSASFDGTGAITDLIFTDDGPDFAKDMASEKASVVDEYDNPIVGSPFTSLADAVAAVNALGSGTYTFALSKGMVIDGTLAFNNSSANIILDFAGFVLTNEAATAAISNAGASLTITNSIETVGGVYCSAANGVAFLAGNGTAFITGGMFNGDIVVEGFANVEISGGSFKQDAWNLGGYLADGKKLLQNQETGLYDVVDIVYYTVGFYDDVQGKGSLIGEEASVEAGTLATAPVAPTKTGYTFVDWTPSTNTAITANTNFYPTWSANTYTITFVIGESSSTVQKAYGSTIDAVPEVPLRPGYTGSWDDNPAGDTVTGDKTYTYTYSAETYTITFVNELGTDPASTNYTIESGTITLPEATTSNVGVQFDGWTNGTYTTATNIFTPSAANLANFTLYAAWSSTGSGSFDGGDGNSFTIDPGTVSSVEALTGHQMTETVAGSSVTYAQAYALGLIDAQGVVAELDATIEMKDGKVVVGLSSAPLAAYTITLKVYEKASLTAAWPATPTQTYTLDDTEATTGFAPGSAGAGFYKTEITISNK